MSVIQRHPVLAAFTCLGDACEDTCCKFWSMQMDEVTLAGYQRDAPELLEAVERDEDGSWIMRKEKESGYCVKLEGGENRGGPGAGLCGIYRTHGDRFLGDACHFYPRVTRQLGGMVTMTAGLSCPEIARLALQNPLAAGFEPAAIERLPVHIKDYLPAGMTQEEALSIHRAFLDTLAEEATSAEQAYARIASVSRSLERLDIHHWAAALPAYLKLAGGHLPPAQPRSNDPFNLLHALCGLIVATHKPPSPRLRQTVCEMEAALCARLDWQHVLITLSADSESACRQVQGRWKNGREALCAPLLRRWLAMQLSLALYPFSGLGQTLADRITIIGVRLATVKLALQCAEGLEEAPLAVSVRCMQSLARLMDHLGDPAFSLAIYKETGWTQEGRMRGLLEEG